MRRLFVILCACLLSTTLVIRATPRACGSTFACCGEHASATQPATLPACCKADSPKPAEHASDEPMPCCMSLALPPTVDAMVIAMHDVAFERVARIELTVETRTLEPATPPPRPLG